MRLDTKLIIFIAVCSAALIDAEFRGLKISQISVFLFSLVFIGQKKVLLGLWRTRFFKFTCFYILLLLATFFQNENYIVLNFSAAVIICLLYGFISTTLVGLSLIHI